MVSGSLPIVLTQETVRDLAEVVARLVLEELRNRPSQPASSVSELRTVEEMVERSEGRLKLGQLRWWLSHRTTNGLEVAVSRQGGRLYFDEALFMDWLFDRKPSRGRKWR